MPLGAETHLWQTDQIDPAAAPATVADALDPDDVLPLSITANASGSSWTNGADGAAWQQSPGSQGTAVHLDGSTGQARAGDAAVPLDTNDNHWDSTDDFSVQAWVRPGGASGAGWDGAGWHVVLGQDGSTISGFLLGVRDNAWVMCMPHAQDQPGDGSFDGDCATSSVPVTPGAWVLLTGVWDASDGKIILYVATDLNNFALPAPDTTSVAHTISAQAIGSFTVGAGELGGVTAGFWNGDIEDPSTFLGVASADQAASFAANGPYNPNNQ